MKLMSTNELAIFVADNMEKNKIDIMTNLFDTLPADQIDAIEEFSACCLVGGHLKGLKQGIIIGGLSAALGVSCGLIYLNHKKSKENKKEA